MAKGKPKKRNKRMQELGYKALSSFVRPAVYYALEKCAEDLDLSHAKYVSGLIQADLVKRGYLGKRMVSETRDRREKGS